MSNKKPDNDAIEICDDLPEDIVKRFQKGNEFIDIVRDDNPASPRDDDGNLGIMACKHRDYDLGDRKPEAHDLRDSLFVMSLWLRDSGELEIEPREWPPQECKRNTRFNIELVGYTYTTKKRVMELCGKMLSMKEIKRQMEDECYLYSKYLNNDAYGHTYYKIEKCSLGHDHRIEGDSCWGFYEIDDAIDDSCFTSDTEPHYTVKPE